MSKVHTNGIEIEYESFGPIACEAMVLISGLGVQMTRWPVSFCEDLATKGYRVIRFDNRDVGYSTSFAPSGVPNLEDIARSLSLGAQPVVPYAEKGDARKRGTVLRCCVAKSLSGHNGGGAEES